VEERKIGTGKMLRGIVLAILILIAAQLLSLAAGNLFVLLGFPAAVGNVTAGVLYPVCALGAAAALCKWVLGLSLEDCKIRNIHIKPLWCAAGVGMPVFVSAVLILTPGHWEWGNLSSSEIWTAATAAVFFYGMGTGIVEELIFRGVIMSLLEYRFNKITAVVVPSVLFGCLHILGNELDAVSVVQLLIAGSMVGVLFSLVTYESGNIWNSALIHGVWNMVMVGGILQIGDTANEGAVCNYVLETKSVLLTGGDFGVEASVVAVAAYAALAALAGWRCRRNGNS